jgi:hypothetical protein
MRTLLKHSAMACLSLLACAAMAAAQGPGQGQSQGYTQNLNVFADKLPVGPGGPAPRHDLNGTWVGPIGAKGLLPGDTPDLTPLGKQLLSQNKPEAKFNVANTNDPFVRTCDPLGFPRNMLFEMRGVPIGELLGMTFVSLPDRVFLLSQFQSVWREIWTDGRALPKNVGSPGKDAADARYYGYSVGRWEADNIFVVDTTGIDDSTWLSRVGYPHTVDAMIHERYTRPDHNDLGLAITVEDPKLYTKPFTLATVQYKWLPSQSLGEQLCIPSRVIEYLSIIGDQNK